MNNDVFGFLTDIDLDCGDGYIETPSDYEPSDCSDEFEFEREEESANESEGEVGKEDDVNKDTDDEENCNPETDLNKSRHVDAELEDGEIEDDDQDDSTGYSSTPLQKKVQPLFPNLEGACGPEPGRGQGRGRGRGKSGFCRGQGDWRFQRSDWQNCNSNVKWQKKLWHPMKDMRRCFKKPHREFDTLQGRFIWKDTKNWVWYTPQEVARRMKCLIQPGSMTPMFIQGLVERFNDLLDLEKHACSNMIRGMCRRAYDHCLVHGIIPRTLLTPQRREFNRFKQTSGTELAQTMIEASNKARAPEAKSKRLQARLREIRAAELACTTDKEKEALDQEVVELCQEETKLVVERMMAEESSRFYSQAKFGELHHNMPSTLLFPPEKHALMTYEGVPTVLFSSIPGKSYNTLLYLKAAIYRFHKILWSLSSKDDPDLLEISVLKQRLGAIHYKRQKFVEGFTRLRNERKETEFNGRLKNLKYLLETLPDGEEYLEHRAFLGTKVRAMEIHKQYYDNFDNKEMRVKVWKEVAFEKTQGEKALEFHEVFRTEFAKMRQNLGVTGIKRQNVEDRDHPSLFNWRGKKTGLRDLVKKRAKEPAANFKINMEVDPEMPDLEPIDAPDLPGIQELDSSIIHAVSSGKGVSNASVTVTIKDSPQYFSEKDPAELGTIDEEEEEEEEETNIQISRREKEENKKDDVQNDPQQGVGAHGDVQNVKGEVFPASQNQGNEAWLQNKPGLFWQQNPDVDGLEFLKKIGDIKQEDDTSRQRSLPSPIGFGRDSSRNTDYRPTSSAKRQKLDNSSSKHAHSPPFEDSDTQVKTGLSPHFGKIQLLSPSRSFKGLLPHPIDVANANQGTRKSPVLSLQGPAGQLNRGGLRGQTNQAGFKPFERNPGTGLRDEPTRSYNQGQRREQGSFLDRPPREGLLKKPEQHEDRATKGGHGIEHRGFHQDNSREGPGKYLGGVLPTLHETGDEREPERYQREERGGYQDAKFFKSHGQDFWEQSNRCGMAPSRHHEQSSRGSGKREWEALRPGRPCQENFHDVGMPGRSMESRQQSVGLQGHSMESRQQSSGLLGHRMESRQQSVGLQGQRMESRQQSVGLPGHRVESRQQSVGLPGHNMGSRQQSVGLPGHSMESRQQSVGLQEHSMGSRQQSVGLLGHSMGSRQQSVGQPGHNMGSRQQSVGQPGHNMGSRQQSIGLPGHSLESRQQSVGQPGHNMESRQLSRAREHRGGDSGRFSGLQRSGAEPTRREGLGGNRSLEHQYQDGVESPSMNHGQRMQHGFGEHNRDQYSSERERGGNGYGEHRMWPSLERCDREPLLRDPDVEATAGDFRMQPVSHDTMASNTAPRLRTDIEEYTTRTGWSPLNDMTNPSHRNDHAEEWPCDPRLQRKGMPDTEPEDFPSSPRDPRLRANTGVYTQPTQRSHGPSNYKPTPIAHLAMSGRGRGLVQFDALHLSKLGYK